MKCVKRKAAAMILGVVYALGGVFAMPVAAVESPADPIIERCVYEVIRGSGATGVLLADEEIDVEVTCKITGLSASVDIDPVGTNVKLGATSDFYTRYQDDRDMNIDYDVSTQTFSYMYFSKNNIRYSGSGNLLEIEGTVNFNNATSVNIDQSFAIEEADKVVDAPETKLQPYITKYEVSSQKIAKGDVFSVVMEVVDPNYQYSQLITKNFDSSIALLADKNFNASNMQGTISNVGADTMGNLKYDVRFNNITYAGPESMLEFRVTYKAQVVISGKVYQTTSDKVMSRMIFETTNESSSDNEYTPNVLITNYTGSGGVVAGKQLNFKVTFKNMSETVPVSNVIITVDGDGNFAMAKGVNKIFVNSIDPLEEVNIDLSMIANKMAVPSSYPIKFDVTYNYQGKQTPTSMASEIAIPITQLDRVRINYVKVQNAWVDTEVEVNYSVLNTGLTQVKNAQIEVFDEQGNSMAILFLGTIDAGKEAKGTNMYLTFSEARDYMLKMKLTYEDENFNTKEMSEDFTVGVQGNYYPPIDPEPFPPIEEPTVKNNNWMFFGGAAAVAALVAGFVLYRRRKNKQGVIDDESL